VCENSKGELTKSWYKKRELGIYKKKENMRTITLAILCTMFCWVNCLAQDDDNNNERKAIGFSFKDYTFKKIFPFDEPFSVKLTDIKPNRNFIKIRLKQYNRNRKKITIDSAQWTRQSASDTTAIVSFFQLKPNTYYEFEIEEAGVSQLTEEQKTTLRAYLVRDVNVQNIINDLAQYYIQQYLRNPVTPYTGVLSSKTKDIKDHITKAIKNADPSYILNPVDPVAILNLNSYFIDRIKDVMDKKAELQDQKDVKAKTSANSALQSLISALKSVNWATLTRGDPEYNSLITFSGDILTSMGAVPDASISLKVNAFQTAVDDAIAAREAFRDLIIDQIVVPNVMKYTVLNSTTRTDFQKNSKFYITLDLGAAYAARIDRFVGYTGVNIYFRPINKSAPLNIVTGIDWWAVRTSLLIGITLSSIEKDNIRKGLIDDKALVTGVGFRVVPFLKVNGGVFVHYRYDQNPLLTSNRYYTSLSPFVSFSLDMDAKALFSGIGNSIFK
jgi:hypothetical protein